MLRSLFRRFGNERGTSAIETAIVFPVMMLLTLTIIQFGTLVYARQSAEEAARYGVRMGVVNVGDPAGGAVAAADDYASKALPWGHTTTVQAPGGVVGTTIRLQVTTNPPNILGPLMGFFGGGGNGYQITAIAEGRMEGWQP
jgi:Flp pilus assembly protein TadG